jgi:hypothetical protein
VQGEHLEVKTALQAEENLDFSGFFTLSREKAPFFAVFRLRSQKALAIVPNGSDFSVQAGESPRLASRNARLTKKIRRIRILDGSQANEQDESRVAYRGEVRHSEENRSALF